MIEPVCATVISSWISDSQRGHSHCSCTRSTSLGGPVERHCTQPRCAHGGRLVCMKSQPLMRHHWWCSPSAPREMAGNVPHWMSKGPGWSCSVRRKDKKVRKRLQVPMDPKEQQGNWILWEIAEVKYVTQAPQCNTLLIFHSLLFIILSKILILDSNNKEQ